MALLRLECEGKHVDLQVDQSEVCSREARKRWVALNSGAAFDLLFDELGWSEGPVELLRRFLAENPDAPEADRKQIEAQIAMILEHRAASGDPYEGRDG
jgi:hypothetical protein